MTRTLGVDDNNDIYIDGAGNLAVVTGVVAVLQTCEHVVKAILKEMVFAQDQGMPYFETVWNGTPSTDPFEAAFRLRIAQVPDVTGIEDLEINQVADRFVYTATIATIYGTGTISNG
jgi:hypothetical protein